MHQELDKLYAASKNPDDEQLRIMANIRQSIRIERARITSLLQELDESDAELDRQLDVIIKRRLDSGYYED